MKGNQIPTKKVENEWVPKSEDEYDADDVRKVQNNAKAINLLYCAINADDYRKISCCTTAKEIWDKLEITYEGTDQVREAKVDFLTHAYELFHMKEGEKVDEMFERFSNIVNDLHALKKTFTDRELVRKILRSLTPAWRSKADAIQESIGVSNVTIDALRGNLKTYESTILNPLVDDQRKQRIALTASTSQPQVDEDEDNEFGLVIKRFNKFMRKEYERKGRRPDKPLKCYGCGELGHIKPNCPNAKKEKKPFKKQRAYISWGGDSGDESSEDEADEAANLCLMAQEDNKDEVCQISSENFFTLEEMQTTFDELYTEFIKASKTVRSIKENAALKENDFQKQLSLKEKDLEKLLLENEKLKEENKFFGKRSADKPE
uniref:CCHC-type domain-containing protein n=1 Tax=Nicotiana tabacum TaxID=4097 RepID=A0A1S3Y8Y9_TOBAC